MKKKIYFFFVVIVWSLTVCVRVWAAPFAYITNTASNNVSVIDTATNAVTGAPIPVGTAPTGVAVAATQVYVTNAGSNNVSVIDTATNAVTGAPIPVGTEPAGVAVTGNQVYVTNTVSNNVSVINTATNTVTGVPIPVGTAPRGLAVNSAGTRVYVANSVSDDVSVIDTATNTVIALISVGTGPTGVAVNPAGTLVYVTNNFDSNVSVIDTATNTVTALISVGTAPTGVAVNPAGTQVYVANNFDSNVSVIDIATDTVIDTVFVGTDPFGVAVNPAGTLVYVANTVSNNVSVIDTATNTVEGVPIPVGTSPQAFGQFIGSTAAPDKIPPVVTAFVIAAASSSLTVPIITFTATDNVGVTGYMVTQSAVAPLASAAGWSATAPTNFTFPSTTLSGIQTLYAWAKDAAGNVSTSKSASVTISLPSPSPFGTSLVVTAFTIASTSNSLTVPITTFTAAGASGVSGYMVTQSAVAPLATAVGWSATPPTNFTFPSSTPSGIQTLYAWAKDAAGNVSTSKSASVTLSLPSQSPGSPQGPFPGGTFPVVTAFAIASTSNSLTVPITTFTATDNVGVTGYMVTQSATAPLAAVTGWSATAQTSFTFPGTTPSGVQTLYAWAKDAAGNVSASMSASVALTPVIPIPVGPFAVTYPMTADPLVSADLTEAKPIGLGAVALGGSSLTIQNQIGPFAGNVDIYFLVYARNENLLFMLDSSGSLDVYSESGPFLPWKSGVTGVNESLFGGATILISAIPPDLYYLGLLVTPAGDASLAKYDLFVTTFENPGGTVGATGGVLEENEP